MGQEDPLEEEIVTYSSIFAREILWTEEPGGLPSMGKNLLPCYKILCIESQCTYLELTNSIGKDPDVGKDCRQEEKGMTEDEMV